MSTLEDDHLLGKIAVRLTTKIIGQTQDIYGSGVIYYTTSAVDYMYVFTALHCVLGRRTKAGNANTYKYRLDELEYILVEHNPKLDSQYFKQQRVTTDSVMIDTLNDLCILKVGKSLVDHIPKFPEIFIHSHRRTEGNFRSSGYLSSNRQNYTPLKYSYVDSSSDNILVVSNVGIHSGEAGELIGGYSGSGLMMTKGPILVGLITKLGDDAALGGNVHVKELSKIDIDSILFSRDQDNEPVNFINHAKKIFIDENEKVVNLSNVTINGVSLNIWKAVGNLESDLRDDWFQDPLRYKDILYSENIHKLLLLSLTNGIYDPDRSELYAVPKEGFTTRKALQFNLIDRIVYQSVTDYIARELDKKVIENNIYSARYNYNSASNFEYFFNHSVELWRKFQYQIHDRLTDENPYLVVADITNFYDNISSQVLNGVLSDFRRHASNKSEYDNAVILLIRQIKKWQASTGNWNNGIPQNREPSSFLANLVLAGIDNRMIGRFPKYYRFMDDIRIICKDKFEARKALMVLIEMLSEIGLNLNSQKTRILNRLEERDSQDINEYTPALDKEIEQICSLMDSGKSRDVQISVNMVNEMFYEALAITQDLTRRKKFKFAIERLQRFSRTPLLRDLIDFSGIVKAITDRFEDNPWHTEIYTRFLMTVDSSYITPDILNIMVTLVTDDDRNIYPWQSYLILNLLAYHKIKNPLLERFAHDIIVNSQGVQKGPLVAGACIYLTSVDTSAVDLIKVSLVKNFFSGHLAIRCALICLQTVAPDQIRNSNITDVEREIHKQAYHRYAVDGKEPVYVEGLPKLKINKISRDLPQVISL